MIKTVIFDLGDVFVNVHPGWAISQLKEQVSHIQETEILEFFNHSDLQDRYQKGLISSNYFYEKVKEYIGGDFSFDYFRTVWQEMFSPIRPMIDLLPKLEKDYILALLSNTDELHIEYIRDEYQFFHHFDHLIFSYEVGLAKPDEAIFRIALGRCDSMPSECVYVDDLRENVQAAAGLGMKGIHFQGYERFVQEWKQVIDPSSSK